MKKISLFIISIISIFGLISTQKVSAQSLSTPTITSLSPVNNSVSKYKKYEINFNISRSYPADSLIPYYYYDPLDTPLLDPGRTSPYGIDGISIDAIFTSPSGKKLTVPAFYYQDHTISGSYSSGQTINSSNNYFWKIRFTPEESGQYTYTIKIQDKLGTSTYPSSGNLQFTSLESNNKGFIKVSPTDPRFFEFSNGESFIPVSSGRQWWLCCGKRYFDYENTFTEFGKNGINFTRIWDQNDGYGLTVEGHFDQYKYPDDFNPENRIDLNTIPKGTQFNQRGNYEEDKIIESAERNGVYIQLTSHSDPYWIWDGSSHEGSWNPNPQKFDSYRHVAYWKRNFRYRVARWGYSPNVMAWETWNEHGHVIPNTEVYNFYSKYSQYQQLIDPYKKLRTTSQGSQSYSPAFWSSNFFDFANYHNYLMGWFPDELKNDEANFVHRTAWCLRDISKNPSSSSYCQSLGLGDGTSWQGSTPMPWVWGEVDAGTNNWNEVNPKTKIGEGRIRLIQNLTWAGLFTPLGTSPLDWYWDSEDTQTTQTKYLHKKIVADFFSDVNYASSKFTYTMTPSDTPPGYVGETIDTSNSTARAYGMKNSDKKNYYAWIQNRNYTWFNSPNIPSPVSTSLTFKNLVDGNYNVRIYDTNNGSISTLSLSTNSGAITVPINNLSKSVAIKINQTGQTTPSVTPKPTILPTNTPVNTPTIPVSPTAVQLIGDINKDNKVNLGDLVSLVTFWQTSPTTSLDQNNDGQINSLDYSLILSIANQSVPTPTKAPTSTPTLAPTLAPTPTSTIAPTPTPNPLPTTTPQPVSNTPSGANPISWTQFGAGIQRSNFTLSEIPSPWKLKWIWNGSDNTGKPKSDHLPVPNLVQPITGGNRIYIVANNTLFAIDKNSTDKQNGNVIWSKSGFGNLQSTPAYESEIIYLAGGTSVYKINAANGQTISTYNANTNLYLAPLLLNNQIIIPTNSGSLLSLSKSTLQKNWEYTPSSPTPAATTAAYSTSKNLVIYLTQDLRAHAVNASTGISTWTRKPTNRTYGNPGESNSTLAQAEDGWPVIADNAGIVFIRYRLDWQTLWDGPNAKGLFPQDNLSARQWLANNPSNQALFALKLQDGSDAFALPPNAGNGGQGDGGYLPMGPLPIIKTINNKDVAYILWRNEAVCLRESWCDSREDTTMGEMVLDNTTVPGYTGGDVRFVQWSSDQNLTTGQDPYYKDMQTDEMLFITGGGNTIFHNHWLTADVKRITDRSNSLGGTYTNPIKTTPMPNTIWRQVYCPPTNTSCNPQIFPGGSGFSWGPSSCQFDANTHYCKDGLYGYGDQRAYSPGFYLYHNSHNPTTNTHPFSIMSDGLVIVKSNDGALLAYESGNPLAQLTELTTNVLGATSFGNTPPPVITWDQAKNYINQNVTVKGKVVKIENRLPKAIYIGLSFNPHQEFLVRVFSENVSKFSYDLNSLENKEIQITGLVTLYWPEGKIPEIIVTEPSQIVITTPTKESTLNKLINIFKKSL